MKHEIFKRTKEYLSDESKWTKFKHSENAAGENNNSNLPDRVKFGLFGALQRTCHIDFDDNDDEYDTSIVVEASEVLVELINGGPLKPEEFPNRPWNKPGDNVEKFSAYIKIITEWEESPEVNYNHIINLLDKAIEITKGDV